MQNVRHTSILRKRSICQHGVTSAARRLGGRGIDPYNARMGFIWHGIGWNLAVERLDETRLEESLQRSLI